MCKVHSLVDSPNKEARIHTSNSLLTNNNCRKRVNKLTESKLIDCLVLNLRDVEVEVQR
jgi:hypothetical protein